MMVASMDPNLHSKTFKIFGVTNEKKFSRLGFSDHNPTQQNHNHSNLIVEK